MRFVPVLKLLKLLKMLQLFQFLLLWLARSGLTLSVKLRAGRVLHRDPHGRRRSERVQLAIPRRLRLRCRLQMEAMRCD